MLATSLIGRFPKVTLLVSLSALLGLGCAQGGDLQYTLEELFPDAGGAAGTGGAIVEDSGSDAAPTGGKGGGGTGGNAGKGGTSGQGGGGGSGGVSGGGAGGAGGGGGSGAYTPAECLGDAGSDTWLTCVCNKCTAQSGACWDDTACTSLDDSESACENSATDDAATAKCVSDARAQNNTLWNAFNDCVTSNACQ